MADDIKSLPKVELVNELIRAAIETLPASSCGNLQEMLRKDERLRELRTEVLNRMEPTVPEDGVPQRHVPLRESQWNEIEDLEE